MNSQLDKNDTLVLGIISRYKIVSSGEIYYHINQQRNKRIVMKDIEYSISKLENKRLIHMPSGGLPKRYSPKANTIVEQAEEKFIPHPLVEDDSLPGGEIIEIQQELD